MNKTPTDTQLMRAAFDAVERIRGDLNSLFYKMEEAQFSNEETHQDRYTPAKHIVDDAANSLLAAIDLLRSVK